MEEDNPSRTDAELMERHGISVKKSLRAAEQDRADVARARRRWIIRVNSVHPGLIETQMLKTAIAADPALWASVAASIPLRRIAEPNEVSGLIIYLASDESRYCTGSEFIIDGGYTAQ